MGETMNSFKNSSLISQRMYLPFFFCQGRHRQTQPIYTETIAFPALTQGCEGWTSFKKDK